MGKQTFTKGLAKGLEINETISSPTFTILKEYDGRLNLKHIDAYRLEGVSSDAIGLFDLLDDRNVVVLEWGKYLDDLDFKIDYLITLDYEDENERTITIEEPKLMNTLIIDTSHKFLAVGLKVNDVLKVNKQSLMDKKQSEFLLTYVDKAIQEVWISANGYR
ncbi:tRNA (adenosine(37)-N6)-threonylcarbamoyltransferase complex ATPase subunit type 1 TsaE [Erysipelothrix sp. Poltava]|nr:tRNA (adenosine(37)-N6)-threonylcarbamoyltransferase complex ATPase subunit type 1 TsaE [Erysipelothrix sp. Poltava]